MTRCYVCFDKCIKITFPNLKLELFQFWLNRFCPNISEGNNCTKFDYEIICNDSLKYDYIEFENSIELFGLWENCESSLAKLVTQVFQKLLVEDDIFIFPAACVEKNGNGLLIIGDFWQGKSSTAIYMDQNFDFNIISDNYVAVKNNYIIGASKFISLRKENNCFKLNSKNILEINNRLFYERENNFDSKLKIIGLLNPFINDSDSNFHIVTKEESVWYLYQKISRLLSGETILFNGNFPSPIFNNKDISIKILRTVNSLIESNNILYASSSLHNICNESYKLFFGDNL